MDGMQNAITMEICKQYSKFLVFISKDTLLFLRQKLGYREKIIQLVQEHPQTCFRDWE